MADPKTFGSDYERGYQSALDDVKARLDVWIEQCWRMDEFHTELSILRKPRTRRAVGQSVDGSST